MKLENKNESHETLCNISFIKWLQMHELVKTEIISIISDPLTPIVSSTRMKKFYFTRV